jgi:hypothetical protein
MHALNCGGYESAFLCSLLLSVEKGNPACNYYWFHVRVTGRREKSSLGPFHMSFVSDLQTRIIGRSQNDCLYFELSEVRQQCRNNVELRVRFNI